VLTKFGLRKFKTRGAKWWRYYKMAKWPLSYVDGICIFLWFDSGFFDAFEFVIDIKVFHNQGSKQWWPWLEFCIIGQSCMWVRIELFSISFILLKLGLGDLSLGFKHSCSTINTHHGKNTREKHTMHRTICNTICIEKVFVCWEIWVIEILYLYLFGWNFGCYKPFPLTKDLVPRS
jgi:hypothetical protein